MKNIIFIHGLESSGSGFKGQFFKRMFPECLTPNFVEFNPSKSIDLLLRERMKQLNLILKEKNKWIIIGSSFGALMGTLFACQNSKKISKLVLLAPYLSRKYLNPKLYTLIKIPVIIFHGTKDKIVPLTQSKILAEKLFINIKYNIVNDDHYLHKTVKSLDWKKLIYDL
ncbi:MAG: hypothetical protein ACFE9Z_12910 [Promethearchaeota archaeon]